MSIIIGKDEVCKFSSSCKFNDQYGVSGPCKGTIPNRGRDFICDLVDNKGVFSESGFRSGMDETGKMKIIMENTNVR